MRSKIFIVLIIALSAGSNYLCAQHKDAGTTAFPLLNTKYDARSIAMSGASVAMPNDLYGVFTNPSTFVQDTGKMGVFLGYNFITDGIWGIPIALSRSFDKYGSFAINLFSVTSGDIVAMDENNKQTGGIARWDFLTGGLTWGYRITGNLSIGASLNGIYERAVNDKHIEYSADGIMCNLGVQYRMNNNRIILGLVLKNAGFMINSYSSGNDRAVLPLTIEGGISFVPKNVPRLRLALDVNKSIGDYINFEPAFEYNIYRKMLFARLGYAFSQKDAMNVVHILQGEENPDYVKSNMSGLCVGTGFITAIKERTVKLDFGMQFQTFQTTPSLNVSALVDLK